MSEYYLYKNSTQKALKKLQKNANKLNRKYIIFFKKAKYTY